VPEAEGEAARRAGRGTARAVRVLGHPVLRTPTDPVSRFDADLRRLVDDLYASMYTARGVGLAANQVGVGLSVVVYDCPDDEGRRHVGHLVNPVLVAADGVAVTGLEGCLSLPGLDFPTPRAARAVVEAVDETGSARTVEGHGWFARCLQHEVDHLLGHVYVDRLTGEDRREALRAVRTAAWRR